MTSTDSPDPSTPSARPTSPVDKDSAESSVGEEGTVSEAGSSFDGAEAQAGGADAVPDKTTSSASRDDADF